MAERRRRAPAQQLQLPSADADADKARLWRAARRIATTYRCPQPNGEEIEAVLTVLRDVSEETRARALEE